MSNKENPNKKNFDFDDQQTHLFDKTTSNHSPIKKLKDKEQVSIFSESSNDNENNTQKIENKSQNFKPNNSLFDSKNNSSSENNFFNSNSNIHENNDNISRSMSSKTPSHRSRSRSKSLSPSKSLSRSISPQNLIQNDNINNFNNNNEIIDMNQNSNNKNNKFVMKNGCCRNCMKAFSKTGKSCLCQVPHKERKFQLPENGCIYCGCKGCNPIDVRFVERKEKKNLLFQDKNILHKNKRILDSDDEDLKIKDKDVDDYNMDKKDLNIELERVLKIHPIFYGYGVPLRTPSYILGYHTHYMNNNNSNNMNNKYMKYNRMRENKNFERDNNIAGGRYKRNNFGNNMGSGGNSRYKNNH